MCLFSSPDAPKPAPVPPGPKRSTSEGFAQEANLTALRARGSDDTTSTSALGDPGFGLGVRRPRFLGQTLPLPT